jgi:hypothetical protein
MASLPETLKTRVERLERSSRRDRAIVFGVIVLALATAQTPSSSNGAPVVVRGADGANATLTSAGLAVYDAAGHRRAFVGLDSGGQPSVDLSDSTGALRESFYLFDGHPMMRQFDAAGKRRAELDLTATDNGELVLSDANQKIRLALFSTSSGDPQIGLYGTDEKLRAFFSTDDVSPYLVMRDAAGQNRISIGGYTDGSIGMDIRNSAAAVLWKVP